MKMLQVNKGLVVFDLKMRATTAGPSPDNNQRVELFLLGCNKAQKGSPCKGCFNSITWDIGKADFSRDPIEVADFIIKNAPNKYITIGGGEPSDQITSLIPLTRRLKENGFHIIMYTWRDLTKALNNDYQNVIPNSYLNKDTYSLKDDIKTLLKNIDIVIDGEFVIEEKLYIDNCDDGLFGSIGSGNQKIWNIKQANDNNNDLYNGIHLKDLKSIKLNPETNDLIYIMK